MENRNEKKRPNVDRTERPTQQKDDRTEQKSQHEQKN